MSDVTRSCPICNSRGPTVREAFALAGFPVPEGARILCFTDNDTKPRDVDWRYDGPMKDRICASGVFKACHRGHWAWDSSICQWDFMIDLSNLPARDAYDALPAVVRAAIPQAPNGGEEK